MKSTRTSADTMDEDQLLTFVLQSEELQQLREENESQEEKEESEESEESDSRPTKRAKLSRTVPSSEKLVIVNTGGVVNDNSRQQPSHSSDKAPLHLSKHTSLLSICISQLATVANQSNGLTHGFFQNVPSSLVERILQQVSFKTLSGFFNENQFLDALSTKVVVASMKQDEDTARHWYNSKSDHPYLKANLNSLLVDVHNHGLNFLQQLKAKDEFIQPCCSTETIGLFSKPMNLVDMPTFKKQFDVFTNGMLSSPTLDWNNMVVAGGSVLASLRGLESPLNKKLMKSLYSSADVDIFLYGLTVSQAEAKIKHIFSEIKKVNKDVHYVRTPNTLTLFAGSPSLPVQIVMSLYTSVEEILLNFDLDCISVAYTGNQVLALPKFLRSVHQMSNCIDSSINLQGKLQWKRLTKYASRGFPSALPMHIRVHGDQPFESLVTDGGYRGNTLPGFHKKSSKLFNTMLQEADPYIRRAVELMSLAKISLLLRHGITSVGITSWPSKWPKGITSSSRVPLNDDIQLSKELVFHHDLKTALMKAKLNPIDILHSMIDISFFTRQCDIFGEEDTDALKAHYGSTNVVSGETSLQESLEMLGWDDNIHGNDINEFFEENGTNDIHEKNKEQFKCYVHDVHVECELCGSKRTVDVNQNASNGFYSDNNTNLASVSYIYDQCSHEFLHFNKVNSQILQTGDLKLAGYLWRISLAASQRKDIIFVIVEKLAEPKIKEPGKRNIFANFVITFVNQEGGDNIHLDGSYVFTIGTDSDDIGNKWTSFVFGERLDNELTTTHELEESITNEFNGTGFVVEKEVPIKSNENTGGEESGEQTETVSALEVKFSVQILDFAI